MISDAYVDEASRQTEAIVEKMIRKMGFQTSRLDRPGGKRRRPDFLVSDSSGPILACEVKTVISGGYLQDRGAHLSLADPALVGSGTFTHPIDLRRIDENLADAVGKHRCLKTDQADLAHLPLLVAFAFDFFADRFRFYPTEMSAYPEVSGIAKILENRALRAAARKLSTEEMKERIDSGTMRGLPPQSKEFLLVENACAVLKLPKHFVLACVPRD